MRPSTSKCVCAPLFLKELGLVLGEYEFAVIHFNNGLHGWDYDEDDYAKGLLYALDFVATTSGRSKLIWGSTTPVWQKGGQGILNPRTVRVRERNRIAATLVADRGILVNDLFGAVIDHPEYFSDDGVHFKREGQDVLGKLVAHAILAETDNITEQSPAGDGLKSAPEQEGLGERLVPPK